MADAAVNLVVEKLTDFAVEKYLLQPDLANKITLLRDKFEWLQTFIRDADQKRHQQGGEYVAVWVRQTRDVAFDVEDALDQFFLKAALEYNDGCFGPQGCTLMLKRGPDILKLRHQLSDQIETMKNRLEEILSNKDEFNIAESPKPWMSWAPTTTDLSDSWQTCALSSIDEDLVSMEDQISSVTNYMLNGPEELTIYPILCVSTAGCGTTSLARKIYNTPEIRRRFDCQAWVTIPKAFCTEDILNEIIRQVSNKPLEDTLPEKDMSKLHPSDRLKNYLLKRRYMVVLDNLPNIEAWFSLAAAFPDDSNNSRVVIAGSYLATPGYDQRTFPVISVNPLDANKSKQLFERYGYDANKNQELFQRHGDAEGPDGFFDIMFQVTKGIPLAIVVLAGVLKSKEANQWVEVLKSIPQNADPLVNIFSLSFDDLLPHFKSCFLYLAALGQESQIDAQRLIRLWIAEGFIQQEKGKTMEELGQDYLKELISRYLIQLVQYDKTNVLTISIHDRLLEFARSEARETNFLGVHDGTETVAPTVRRLYFRDKSDKHVSRIFRVSKLRSILCDVSDDQRTRSSSSHNKETLLDNIFRGGKMINGYELMLSQARLLRVIELKGARVCSLPKEIGTMIYLRYLGLMQTGLKQIPPSIVKLQNLQTLDTTGTDVTEVPEAFWHIETLRHVLTKKVSPPNGVGILDELQTLIGVGYGEWVQGMEKMESLRTLQMWGLSSLDCENLLTILRKLGCLVSLDLQGEEFPFDEFSKIGLQRLKTLRLFGMIVRIPSQMSMRKNKSPSQIILPNLLNLTLVSTKVTQDFISALLKDAVYLERLELGKDSYIGNTLAIHDRMTCLKYLVLADLDLLEEWKFNPNVVSLCHITISNCPMLETLPNFASVKYGLNGIKRLEVYNAPKISEKIRLGKLCDKLIEVHSVLSAPVTIN